MLGDRPVLRSAGRDILRQVGWHRGSAFVIVATQAVWLAAVASRGWFYQDDYTFLGQATHRNLSWSYLGQRVNDHLTPGLRLQFWVIRTGSSLNWDATVLYRVVLQVATLVALYRLLVRLFGRQPGVLFALAAYGFSPLIAPGFLWLSSATNVMPAELLIILAVGRHVEFVRRGRLRDALLAGVAVLGAALFWEKSVTVLLWLPALSLFFLLDGPFRRRLREFVHQVPGVILETGPTAAFFLYFVTHGYGSSGQDVPVGTLLSLVGDSWLRTFGVGLAGGPQRWFSVGTVYVPAGDPITLVVVLGQVVFVALLLLGIRRNGVQSLLAWVIPAVSVITGTVLVAIGRYQQFGDLITRIYSYAYDVALPLLLAVCLALMKVRSDEPKPRPRPYQRPRPPSGMRRTHVAVVGAVVAVCVLSCLSTATFAHRFHQSPSRRYFAALQASLSLVPAGASVYDTRAPDAVVPAFNAPLYLSDLAGLAGVHGRFDGTDANPLLIDSSGHLKPTSFLRAASGLSTSSNPFCDHLLQNGPLIITLDRTPGPGNWFLRLDYFRQQFGAARVRVLDQDGRSVVPLDGAEVRFDDPLGFITLRLPPMNPRTIVITPTQSDNICISQAAIGAPFKVGP